MPVRALIVVGLVVVALAPADASGQDTKTPASRDAIRLEQSLVERLASQGENVSAAVWLGSVNGPARFTHNPAAVMPTASAIKTFYLVEFFAAHRDNLDAALPNAAEFLHDDHPAVSHFSATVRDEIRNELTTASVRRIGQVMQGKTDVSNAVYNAAANLVTAELGGPEKLTSLIHARDPRFQTIMVRRYMLRDRTQPGDNEGTAEAFAALYQSLAAKRLSGIDEAVMIALHDVLRQRREPPTGALYEKDGGLGSNPLTSVRAGWQQTSRGPVVFVVMCRQGKSESDRAEKGYDELRALTLSVRDELLHSATNAK